jgi:tripartite ATP-independent transporter DctM subunit
MNEIFLGILLISILLGLLSGFPVAFVLSGVALIIALIGNMFGSFDMSFLHALPSRIYGIMSNDLLIAVPLFIFMGGSLGNFKSGIGISVMFIGALLAASTGIVGATVVTMGLISLPTMLKNGYNEKLSTGSICAAGTLGQVIPPSIVLILLGDQISNAHQNTQMKLGNFAPDPVTVADLFMGALVPGLCLVFLYILWIIISCKFGKHNIKTDNKASYSITQLIKVLAPPLLLIFVVLGSILSGIATATESAAVGSVGAMLLAFTHQQLTIENLRQAVRTTARSTCMVFTILIGAAVFTLVFRGFGGDDIVHEFLNNLSGGLFMAMLVTMLLMFFLGFFLDFIEIIFVVVPIVTPILLAMGADPVWLSIMIAVNLQTSFMTPPFGFSLFYLRNVAPKSIKTSTIYKGVIPFVIIQLVMLALLATYPTIATWLPKTLYGTDFSQQKTASELSIDGDFGNTVDW